MEMLDYESVVALKAKQIETGSLSTIRISDDEVIYKGKVIRRHNDVLAGYGGRYSLKHKLENGKLIQVSFSRLSDAKKHIDSVIK